MSAVILEIEGYVETLFTQIQSSIDLTMVLSNFQRCSLLRLGWGSPEAPAPSPIPLELSVDLPKVKHSLGKGEQKTT